MTVNSENVYLEAVTAHQLPQGIGVVSLSHLALAFSQMARELRIRRAGGAAGSVSGRDRIRGRERPASDAQRADGRAERLHTAFDGLPRHHSAMAVRVDFLRQVRMSA
jgi:hypothetical protein